MDDSNGNYITGLQSLAEITEQVAGSAPSTLTLMTYDDYGNYQAGLQSLGAVNAVLSGTGGAGLSGSGSPEGVQAAAPGTTYLDTATEDLWIKKTGSGKTGWIELIGE